MVSDLQFLWAGNYQRPSLGIDQFRWLYGPSSNVETEHAHGVDLPAFRFTPPDGLVGIDRIPNSDGSVMQ